MGFAASLNNAVATLIGVYKTRSSYTTDYVVNYLVKLLQQQFDNVGCIKCTVLKSPKQGFVAVYAIFQTERQEDGVLAKPPQIDKLSKDINEVAETVDFNWYEISTTESKGRSSPWQLSKGDVVHIRSIITKPDRQDLISYSCLAITKAYFYSMENILCSAFYNSLDGRKIIELGIWEGVEAADKYHTQSPGLPFWKGLGATFTYCLYEVAHTSTFVMV